MSTVQSILTELKGMGSESTRNIYIKHGAPADKLYGVKVGDMKTIVKRIKKNHELALGLYDSGISDAMYLAGLIGDETKMTKADLNRWAKNSSWYMTSEYAVPFVAAESPYGWELALEWIQSPKEHIASAGWSTLGSIVSITPDDQLDQKAILKLMKEIEKTIHTSANRVRYTMNGFILSVGAHVKDLYPQAIETAKKIGKVDVEMGGTACQVPEVISYLKKLETANRLWKKRKTARC